MKLQHTLAALALAASPLALHADSVFLQGPNGAQGFTPRDPNNGQVILGQAGGAGGDAVDVGWVVDKVGDKVNEATVIGGNGGNAGISGGPGPNNTPPAFGNHGGNGGNATATAIADLTDTGGGNVEAWADARGGAGGEGGPGGSRPHMDGPGAWGGNSVARATAKTTNGSVIASANAASPNGGSGNMATASAQGSNTSADPVNVVATARGGDGPIKRGNRLPEDESPRGRPGRLGVVSGFSTGGGNVKVEGNAYGGKGGGGVGGDSDGGDASITDALTGSTTGTLSLSQHATGGLGGQGWNQDAGWGGYFPVLAGRGGKGGDASSILNLSYCPASSLAVDAFASGGGGGSGTSGGPGLAGTATAGGNISGTGHLSVNYSATGGYGGVSDAGFAPGGAAILLPCSAVSTGTEKTVAVTAYQQGGSGGGTRYYSPWNAGDGAASSMSNIVSGAAPGGSLTLTQMALGGGGGEAGWIGSTYSGALAGGGGDAFSTLDFTHSGEAALTADVEAYGGFTGIGWGSRRNKAGGAATANGRLQDSGEVTLIVKAIGGYGGDAGNADAVGSAISTGSGTAALWVEAKGGKTNVDRDDPGTASLTAYGQSVTGLVSVFGTAEAGGGIAADGASNSGRVDGRSIVLTNAVTGRTQGKLILSQSARAGAGTGDVYTPGESAGDGGDATSSLITLGGNPDGGPLEAYAYAYGGDSTAYNTQTVGAPGDAVAVCDFHNAGNVRAEARAEGGVATKNTVVGRGAAQASANAVCTQPNGSSMAVASLDRSDPVTGGPATATAESFGGIATRLRASSIAPATGGSAYTTVGCAVGANIYNPQMSVVGLPTNPLSLSGAPNTSAAFVGATRLADMSITGSLGSASTTVAFNTSNFLGRARLSLLSGTLSGPVGSLASVRFTVTRAAITVVDVTFNTPAQLQSYFTDHVVDLGRANVLGEVVCTFTVTGGDANTWLDAKVLLAASPLPAPVNYQPNASAGGGTFIDISTTGAQVIGSNVDDGVSNLIPIGFTFPFLGTNYTELYASSNGLVTFGGGNSDYNNIDFAAQMMGPDLDAIAVLWDDWVTEGGVFAQTIGAPGQRTFIVQWNLRAFSGTSADPAVFQMQIFESTGDILIICPDSATDGGNSNGSSATLGLRKAGAPANGFVSMHSFNSPNVPSGTQVRFSLPRPVVGGLAATSVTGSSATLGGVINPNGISTNASFQYGPTTSFGSSASVVLAPDDGSSGQNVSAALSGLTAATTYYYQLTATNDAGTSILSGSFTTLSQQQDWRQLYFGTGSNTGNAADNADPDGDGLENLLEWACNLNPTTSNPLNTVTGRDGATLTFVYPRGVAALTAGVIFNVEWSDTTAPNSWSAAGVTQQVLSDNGVTQQVQATLPAGTGGQRFVRLRVTAPP